MLVSCHYCGKMHPRGQTCPMRPKYRGTRHNECSEEKKLRSTYAWTQKAIGIKKQDQFLCCTCRENGIYRSDKLETHHIVPIAEAPEMAFDDDNLITLCEPCHKLADAGEISREKLRELIKKRK